MVASEVYERLLIKAETPMNLITSTTKQTHENLNTIWNRVLITYRRVKQVKLRRAKDERNATAHPLQKTSIDKLKEEKMNFKTTFT